MDISDSIYYRGPDREFRPDPGASGGTREAIPATQDPQELETLFNRVLDWSNSLINFHTDLLTQYQMELNDFSLVVHPTATDDAILRAAHEASWKNLGLTADVPEYVNYWQFLALEKVPTSAAMVVRDRWESGIRDATGTMAYDLSLVSNAIIQESTYLKSYIDNYLGQLDDTSEVVILRLYDDWLSTASVLSTAARNLWQQRETDSSKLLGQEDLRLANEKNASDSQALIHAKLDIVNRRLSQSFAQLQKNFLDYADVFYSKFFGPALDYRLRINRYQTPYRSGPFQNESYSAAQNLDAHLSMLMADQMRRQQSFGDEMQEIIGNIRLREQYKDLINSLANIGSPYAVGAPGTMMNARLPASVQKQVTEIIQDAKTQPDATKVQAPAEHSFTASHNELDNREDPDAHPQYVTRDELEASTGIKLKGLDRAKQVASENAKGLDVATVATAGGGPAAIHNVIENGLVTATSTTRPANPTSGQMIYESDTKAVLYWDSKKWQYVTGGPPDYTFTFMTMGT